MHYGGLFDGQRSADVGDYYVQSLGLHFGHIILVDSPIQRDDEYHAADNELFQGGAAPRPGRDCRKARLSTEVTFRRKGNEKQYRFNELVQDKLALTSLRIEEASENAAAPNPTVTTTSATSSTSTNSLTSSTTGPVLSALQQAKAAVEEGMTLLKDRQKAIRLHGGQVRIGLGCGK